MIQQMACPLKEKRRLRLFGIVHQLRGRVVSLIRAGLSFYFGNDTAFLLLGNASA